ncbi:MAG: ferritin-like domain-containing protein [Anaerolineae bacterium]
MAHEELLNAWLKDAYSMEMGLVPILKQHADDAKDLPEVRRRDEQHVEETKRHAEMVKACIERRGDNVSSVKTAIGGMVGTVQSVATAPFGDEPVKNSLSDYAAENFEVASYRALVAAAEQLGDNQTAQVCRQIMQEDMAMAQWIEQHMSTVVNYELQKKAAEHSKS